MRVLMSPDSKEAAMIGSRYLITYATGDPAIGATVTRVFTAYSYAAARGTALEFARKVLREFGTELTVTSVGRL
jgi:hypothetical protein